MQRLFVGLAVASIAALTALPALAGDAEIAQEIVKRLREQQKQGNLAGFNFGVRVEQGDAWLQGSVASEDQRTTALEVTRRVRGVKRVVNDLSVSGGPAAQSPSPGRASRAMKSMSGAVTSVFNKKTSLRQPTGSGVAPASAQQAPPQPVRRMPPQPVRPAAAMMSQQPVSYAGGPMPAYVPGTGGGVAPARFDRPQMPGYAWPSYAAHPNYAALSYPKQYSPSAWPYIGPFYPYPQVPLGWRKVTLEWDDGWWMLDFKSK